MLRVGLDAAQAPGILPLTLPGGWGGVNVVPCKAPGHGASLCPRTPCVHAELQRVGLHDRTSQQGDDGVHLAASIRCEGKEAAGDESSVG